MSECVKHSGVVDSKGSVSNGVDLELEDAIIDMTDALSWFYFNRGV